MAGITRRSAGACAAGSHWPLWPACELSLTAATTWPALACTCSPIAREPRTRVARDCITMPCAGTLIPVSTPVCSGPVSVTTSTSTVAAWLSVFIR
jgi:hypothetical protein